MNKTPLGINVLEASQQRIKWVFDNFRQIYLCFSGGKDSTVMLHLVLEEVKKREQKIGVLFIDLEAQYQLTIVHVKNCLELYQDYIEQYWVCLPLNLRNSVSVYQPQWICWNPLEKYKWVRQIPRQTISSIGYFDFFKANMEFEDFAIEFGEWYARVNKTVCLVGVRTDESLNRLRAIAASKATCQQWMTQVSKNVYNVYPLYDWKTEDIWIYHAKNFDKPYNKLYEYMRKAGLSIHQARICQPYGDDQKRGLWLFHIIEPETWAKIIMRVCGTNSGALFSYESGNISGYNRISKPVGHTWQSFAKLLVYSMPEKTKYHYRQRINQYIKKWNFRDYQDGIPEQVNLKLEQKGKIPSWRQVCKVILNNDYWCKGLGFQQEYVKYQN